MTTIKAKKYTPLEDGAHAAIINDLALVNRKGFDYLELYLQTDSGATPRFSMPANLSIKSALGKLVMAFGLATEKDLQAEKEIDLGKLAGTKCKILVETKETERGNFTNVLSVKPAN